MTAAAAQQVQQAAFSTSCGVGQLLRCRCYVLDMWVRSAEHLATVQKPSMHWQTLHCHHPRPLSHFNQQPWAPSGLPDVCRIGGVQVLSHS